MAAAAIGVAVPGSATAATFKWVDETGVTNYAAYAPPNATARELSRGSMTWTSPEGSSSGAPTVRDLERAFQERRSDRLDREARETEVVRLRADAQRKCDAARVWHEALTSGRRVLYPQATGEHLPVYGSYQSFEIQRATEQIRTYC